MGTTWEVHAYLPQSGGGYAYEQEWGGQSLIRCLIEARRANRTAGCVRIEWRS